MTEKIAAAAARVLGFTPEQHAAYLGAIKAAPLVGPRGAPVPLHDIGMLAARAAGYAGADHPSRY